MLFFFCDRMFLRLSGFTENRKKYRGEYENEKGSNEDRQIF